VLVYVTPKYKRSLDLWIADKDASGNQRLSIFVQLGSGCPAATYLRGARAKAAAVVGGTIVRGRH
jgi:hypothetical protein